MIPIKDNTVLEYNKISKYKDQEVVGALGMIKKWTDKRIEKIQGSPSQYEI